MSDRRLRFCKALREIIPIIDGNKRVALATCAVFLRLNGFRLVVDADPAEHFLVDEVIGAHAELEAITEWLEAHMQAC